MAKDNNSVQCSSSGAKRGRFSSSNVEFRAFNSESLELPDLTP